MNAARAFAELRALTSGEPSQRRRDDAYACIDAFHDQASPSERAHFEQGYLPYILDKLESWPIELRWSTEDALDSGQIWLSKILRVSRSRGITEAQVHEYRQALVELRDTKLDQIQGVWFEFDGIEDPIEDVLAVSHLIERCRHVEFDIKERHRFDSMHKAMEAIIDIHGDTIEHLSVSHALVPTLVPMLEALPSLQSLAVQGMLIEAVSHEWFGKLARSPVAKRLKSLDVNVLATRFHTSWMRVGGAWQNLSRLRLLGLPEPEALEIARLPALQDVQIWNLADNASCRRRDWLDAKTRLWTARIQGKDFGEVLRHEHVDLVLLPREQVHTIFHDEHERLRPSTSIQSLRMSRLTRDVFESLISRGHKAYPNLTHLCASSADYISPQDYRALDASPIWEQLEDFNWGRLQLSEIYHTRLTVAQRKLAYLEWYEVMTDEHMNLTLRRRAWATVMQSMDGRKDLEALARAVKLPGRSNYDAVELRERLEALAP